MLDVGLFQEFINQELQVTEGKETHLAPNKKKVDALVKKIASSFRDEGVTTSDIRQATDALRTRLSSEISSNEATSWANYFGSQLAQKKDGPNKLVELKGGPFKITPIDELLLISHTDYFGAKKNFENSVSQNNQTIVLKDVSVEDFQLLLKVLADPGSVLNSATSKETLHKCMWFADYFQSSFLTEKCLQQAASPFLSNAKVDQLMTIHFKNWEDSLVALEELYEIQPTNQVKKYIGENLSRGMFCMLSKEAFVSFAEKYGPYTSSLTLPFNANSSWLKELHYFPNLIRLNLSNAKITDAGLAHLPQCKALTSIDLSSKEQITDTGVAYLSECKALTSIDLTGCKQITDISLANLSKLPRLSSLNLTYCFGITGVGVANLKTCKALTWLNLTGCYNATDADQDFPPKVSVISVK